jgi:hypothetical protein
MNKEKSSSRWIRVSFSIFSLLFFISIIIQIFLAGVAIFADIGHWSYHESFIHYFEFVPIGMLILSFFGGIPKMFRWQSAGLYLMIILQYVTANLIGKVPYISALHPIIAMILFWRALVIVQESMKLMKKN